MRLAAGNQVNRRENAVNGERKGRHMDLRHVHIHVPCSMDTRHRTAVDDRQPERRGQRAVYAAFGRTRINERHYALDTSNGDLTHNVGAIKPDVHYQSWPARN